MAKTTKLYYEPREVAALCGIHPDQLTIAVRKGLLPPAAILSPGGRRRWAIESIERHLAQQRAKAAAL